MADVVGGLAAFGDTVWWGFVQHGGHYEEERRQSLDAHAEYQGPLTQESVVIDPARPILPTRSLPHKARAVDDAAKYNGSGESAWQRRETCCGITCRITGVFVSASSLYRFKCEEVFTINH